MARFNRSLQTISSGYKENSYYLTKWGNTPLILSDSLSNLIGNETKVFLKYDGLNPTGSFKDRGMTMAISKAKEEGREAVICASTGNTSAAAAAYASRGGLKPYVLIPEGFVAQGKLAQALMYGAEIISINGNFDKALEIVRDLSSEHPIELVNSVNPYRIEGQKTAAFEIVDDLGVTPDWLCIPMGNAGNITAYWLGFKEYSKIKRNLKLPIMMGFQSEGSAPLVKNIIVKEPETIATAIRIGNPVNREKAKRVQKEGGQRCLIFKRKTNRHMWVVSQTQYILQGKNHQFQHLEEK